MRFRVYLSVFFHLFFCIGLSLFGSESGVYSESPVPAFSNASGLSVTSAVTSDPIHLLSGAVTETVFDLSLPTPLVQYWYHKRTYSSDMSTGVADKELIGLQGQSWLGGNQSQVLLKNGNKIIFVQSASNKRTFTENNGQFTAPSDFDATLVKRGTDAAEEYVLTRNDSKEVFIYYGFNTAVSSYLRGKLKERTNLQYQAQELTGELYSYDERGLVTEITTASPQLYCIRYTYDTDGMTTDKLTKIEIFTGVPESGDSLKIAEADYTYFESLSEPSSDLGSFGDLVQVKISTLASDQTTWQTRVTQYRYYHSSSSDGVSHQLKAVFESDAVERILTENNTISSSDDILQQPDSAVLGSDNSVLSYASRVFTYYMENLDTDSSVTTAWGTENLATKYGGTNQNELKQLVDGSGNPVSGSFIPRVKTETVNAGCFSCGGSSGGGLKKTYFYMGLNSAPSDYSNGIPNVVTYLVVEDTVDSGNTPVQRTIYGLDYRGVELRRVDMENPLASPLNTVCTSKTYNSQGKVLEQRSSSVHSSVISDTLIAQFLNPVNPSDSTWGNDSATIETSKGLIQVFDYDNDGNRIASKLKVGSGGTAYFVSASDFNSNWQETATYIYPTQTSNRAASDRVTTTYTYTYWDTAQKVIKTKTTTQQAVPTTQNGSGVAAVTNEYNDESGRLRWSRDALGVVSYYGYQPENGLQNVIIKDVNTSSLPPEVLNTWTGTVPFPRETTLPPALNQTTRYEYDERGRLTANINAAGTVNYIIYGNNRFLRFSAWDATAQKPLLPIDIRETNAVGKTLESYQLPPTAVTVVNGKPTGVSTSAAKVSWTRYAYNSAGLLLHLDRYHLIPTNDTGTLGTNFYRTTSIYDTQGREVATAQFVQVGKWQVNYKIYDWQNRITEIQRGVAMNPPVFADLSDATWLKTISKIFYSGELIDKLLSFFDIGTNDYTGTKYHYDQWNRVRSASKYSVSGGTETSFGPYVINDYDWRGKVTAVANFETEPSWTDVVSNPNFASNTASSRSTLTRGFYDSRDKLFRREIGNIASNGTVNSVFSIDYYYNLLGQLVATQQVNSAAVEVAYNALGQIYQQRKLLSLSSTKFSNGKFQYRNPQPQSDPSNMSDGGDGILTIQHSDLDSMGRVIGQHSFDLAAGQTSGISLSSNNYVRHTLYLWYDQVGRPITQVNYGSGTSIWGYVALPTRPNIIPSESSESLLLTQVVYNSTTGRLNSVINPKGIVTKLDFDALGRRNSVITNFVSGGTNNDQNLETQFIYNGLNAITLQTVVNPTTGNQVTRYLYEDLYNALLQTSMILPNSSDTNSSGTNQIKKSYYLDGNIKTITDQNGTIRTIGYDVQRRMISDQVTILGSGVDNTIVKFTRSYNLLGLLEKVSAYGTGNTISNETKFDYDSNHRLIKKYDSHNGVVNVSNTPFLVYTYDDTIANGFIQNAGRLTGVDYPGGKHIEYSYNSQGSIDDLLNRLKAVTVDSLAVANYDYSGNNRFMEVVLPEPGTSLTYQDGGLDRYGRIVNHSWIENNQPLVHIIHGYDYAGNRTHRHDAVHALSSELFSYDAVNQIKSLQRGTLDNNFETVTNLTFNESWNFDKTGNWLEYGKNGTTQTRTANTANQILSINGNTTSLVHDANGNMLKIPKPDESGNHFIFKYDAWNHVTAVYESDGSTKVAEYFYNGLGHRTTKKTYVSGILTETRNYFYNENWQCIEERVGETIDRTYVWGPRGIDDLVMRERGEERLYPLTDPNNNVVAIIDSTGEVKERYCYDAFGKVTYLNPDFSVKTASQYDWDFLFTSRRLDKETGLMYYRNRYYHPVIGRFTTTDPSGYDAGDVNLYRYVNNQPEIMVDPMGLKPPITLEGILENIHIHPPKPQEPPGQPVNPPAPNIPPIPPQSDQSCGFTFDGFNYNTDFGFLGLEGSGHVTTHTDIGELTVTGTAGMGGNPHVSFPAGGILNQAGFPNGLGDLDYPAHIGGGIDINGVLTIGGTTTIGIYGNIDVTSQGGGSPTTKYEGGIFIIIKH